MITLERVSYRYAGAARPSLTEVDLELRDGEFVAIVGATDAGKTTLCLVLAGLAPRAIRGALTGTVRIDGQDVTGLPMHALASSVGIAFQDPGAQRSGVAATVYEEVAFGPANLGVPRAELIDRVEGALAALRIERLAGRDPAHLSGGEGQLVAIAGLLAMRPRHLVLDEPTAQLDAAGSRAVMDAVRDLAAAGLSIVVADHRVDELASVAGRALVLESGRVVEDGPADLVLASPRMRERGLGERSDVRLARLVREAGLYPRVVLAGTPD